jgi:tripartite ATP-independent transporter DctM subunit
MSKVAMPSMRKVGYADSLATGAVAAGGTLGILIPPSVILIIYGIIAEADIGKLFLAGLLPGLLGVVLYALAVYVVVKFKPSLAPKRGEKIPLERRDIVGIALVVGLFSIIMVGIYGGLFTPSEAAAVGAFLATLIAIFVGKLTLKGFLQVGLDTIRPTAMIFTIIIGAEVFSNFISFAGLPDAILSFVQSLKISAYVVILLLVLIYIILGAVLESLSMILLTVPIFYPLVMSLDFGTDVLSSPEAVTIWFGIVVVVVTEISLISPPIGLNVFVLRTLLPDISIKTMFTGILPFWFADIIRLLLLINLPSIALWLVL